MNRAEHLAWCKQRAFEYCDSGEWDQALSSMISDLRKHPETAGHGGIQLGMLMLMAGQIKDAESMRTFIEGFN